jgi:signal transduction histidine kinase
MLGTQENIEPLNIELLHDMNDAVQRAVALTRQLLAFSRKQVGHSEDFVVDERIPSIAKLWRRALSNTIRLNVELNAPNSQVRMPIGSLEQSLVNLIVNAQDAMPKGGCMTLRTELMSFDCLPQHAFGRTHAQGRYVVATLTDDGCGMTTDTLKKAFDLFYTTKAKGTGFGLATVYGLVTQAGGFVTLESTQGKGTRVGICLPLLERSCATDTLAPTSGVQLSSIVLAADDDNCASRKPMSLEDIAKFLER